MARRQRPAFRGAAIIVCASLASTIYTSDAWTSKSSKAPLSSQRSPQTRLFLSVNGVAASLPVNPNPTKRRRRRHAAKLEMASSSSATTTEPKTKRKRKNSKRGKAASAVESQRRELLNHDTFTRQQELDLGAKVVRANQLRASIASIIQDKKASLQQEIFTQVYGELDNEQLLALTEHQVDLDEMTSTFSTFPTVSQEEALFDPDGMPMLSGDEMSLENHFSNRRELGISNGIDDLDDGLLTEEEIIVGLELPGGRAELQRILLEGTFARDRLIRNNVRLVVSIAKRWARQSAKFSNEDGARLVTIYAGNAYRPSLDEAIQEGILGLAKAADRYDPSRGLRFSTYSTFWITSSVRNCFQSATTGSLRIPAQLHLIKSRHQTLLKSYYDTKKEIPSEEVIAAELGVTVNRLRTALRATQRLLSIDGPLSGPGRGSAAGGDTMGDAELLISDTLQCTEARPEDQVELSFLRQSLENAMASELSPHERDVLRLRLGLDDGVSRTIREVAEACGGNLSMSEVRLAEQRAYKKLRAPYSLANYQLIAFLDFAGVDQSSMKRF